MNFYCIKFNIKIEKNYIIKNINYTFNNKYFKIIR